MELHFAQAWVLHGLWLLLPLGILWLRLGRRAPAWDRAFSPAMLARLAPPAGGRRFYLQWCCLLAGGLLALLAAARPQWGLREETVVQRGRDLVIALDVSSSMLARDVHPSRLQRAKADIRDLLRELRGDRVALVAFRSRAVLLCPLTADYGYLEQVLNEVDIASAPRGATDIGAALQQSLEALGQDPGAHRAIVLISDGEDLAGQGRAAAAAAGQQGVVVFTVGLGDPRGARIPAPGGADGHLQYRGEDVVTRLDHDTLRAVAEAAGGVYVPVGMANVKLGTLYRDHLSKLAARELEETLRRSRIERYQWFLAPGLLLLLAAAGLSRGRLASGRHTAQSWPAAAALVLWLGLPAGGVTAATTNGPAAPTGTNGPAAAVSAPEGARRAQALYRLGRHGEAAAAYRQAAATAPEKLRNDLLYNAGCALYRAGQFQAAADTFAAAAAGAEQLAASRLRAPGARAAAGHYNAGCAWFRLAAEAIAGAETNRDYAARAALLERAGNAFQLALRAAPDRAAARGGLAAVAQALPPARAEAKNRALLEKYGAWPPGRIAEDLLAGQRALVAAAPAAFSNPTPARIALLEDLAGRQDRNADLVIPLRASLAAAGQPPPEMIQHLEAVQTAMRAARSGWRDLDPSAQSDAAAAEAGAYHLWKALADFPGLLQEDLRRQTNALDAAQQAAGPPPAATRAALAEQREAAQLTGLFTNRFAQAVPPEGLAAPANDATNQPAPAGITPETRARILELASETLAAQQHAARELEQSRADAAQAPQRRAHALLLEIKKLLPPDQSPQSQSPSGRQEQEEKQEQKDQQEPQTQKQQQEKQEPQDQQSPEQSPAQEPPPAADQAENAPAPEEERAADREMTPKQARTILEKALQREKERREEEMRRQHVPLSPVDRDW